MAQRGSSGIAPLFLEPRH